MTESELAEFERAVYWAKWMVIEEHIADAYCEAPSRLETARALLHARDAALEEAAKYVQAHSPWKEGLCWDNEKLVSEIRSLKSNQSKAPEGGGGR